MHAIREHVLPLSCGWCYAAVNSKLMRCGRCRKRGYCSKECQLRDWKYGAHRHWCGGAGELGYDVAISPIEGKGFGMFAMRSFRRGEKILVERAVVTKAQCATSVEGVPEGVQRAAASLMPRGTTHLTSKFNLNGFEMDDGDEGLFIHMAYANHACMAAAMHLSMASQGGLKLLVAARDVQAGEEICHNYIGIEQEAWLSQRGQSVGQFLKEGWGFECKCVACGDPPLRAKLTRACELDMELRAAVGSDVRLPGGPAKFDAALVLGDELLVLHQQLRLSPSHDARAHFLLFQLGIVRLSTLAAAREHIRLAWESRVLLVGERTACAEVKRFERLAKSPESHQAYLAGEPV